MSEKKENDQYRDRIKKADDGRALEHHNFGKTNKEDKEKKKDS